MLRLGPGVGFGQRIWLFVCVDVRTKYPKGPTDPKT